MCHVLSTLIWLLLVGLALLVAVTVPDFAVFLGSLPTVLSVPC